MTKKQIASIILLGASIIYALIPVDLIPDVPFIGWLDDTLVTSSAALNCLQQFSENENPTLIKILKWAKWACFLLAVLIIILVLLFATLIVSLFK